MSRDLDDMEAILDALGDVRIRFWICPVNGHSDREGTGGRPVVTVDWRGDTAYCTADGCGRNSSMCGKPGVYWPTGSQCIDLQPCDLPRGHDGRCRWVVPDGLPAGLPLPTGETL